VPHGDVVVFALSCAQIMYAFLMRPDTFPKSYASWINTVGQIPKEAISLNCDMVGTHTFNHVDLERALSRPDLHPGNVTALEVWRAAHPPYGPCAASHPHVVSCMFTPIDRFFSVFRWRLPIYGDILHIVPMLLFKRKAVAHTPVPMIRRAILGTMRSSTFVAMFVVIYQGYFCATQNAHRVLVGRPHIPKWLLAALVPSQGLVFRTGKHGSALLTAIGMGMVMSTYQNDPQHLSGLVRRIFYQFIVPN